MPLWERLAHGMSSWLLSGEMTRRESVLLAYVFWHWRRAQVNEPDYEARQKGFHAALSAAPPDGFIRSSSAAIHAAAWAADGGASYEDWYLVQDFTALGHLNEAAISGSRAAPHQAAASAAAGGSAGIYGLRLGDPLVRPRFAAWFQKPHGMSYVQLDSALEPLAERGRGALWMRQMTLGPAPEFCLHSEEELAFPSIFAVQTVALRRIWPDGPAAPAALP